MKKAINQLAILATMAGNLYVIRYGWLTIRLGQNVLFDETLSRRRAEIGKSTIELLEGWDIKGNRIGGAAISNGKYSGCEMKLQTFERPEKITVARFIVAAKILLGDEARFRDLGYGYAREWRGEDRSKWMAFRFQWSRVSVDNKELSLLFLVCSQLRYRQWQSHSRDYVNDTYARSKA